MYIVNFVGIAFKYQLPFPSASRGLCVWAGTRIWTDSNFSGNFLCNRLQWSAAAHPPNRSAVRVCLCKCLGLCGGAHGCAFIFMQLWLRHQRAVCTWRLKYTGWRAEQAASGKKPPVELPDSPSHVPFGWRHQHDRQPHAHKHTWGHKRTHKSLTLLLYSFM